MKIVKVIGASIGVIVCFFYLGCGSVQIAEAAHNTPVSSLAITTRILPSAIIGTPYVAALDASGGTPGYSWKITSGSLPTGLTLAATGGVISGTPTAVGNFSFSVILSDTSRPSQTKSSAMTISVAARTLAITASALPSAAAGKAYSQTLQATGGVPPYKWSVTSGSLPVGLTLTNSGLISGTSTAGGTSNFTATVQDNERQPQTASLGMTIVVASASLPLQIKPSALPAAVTGTPYSQVVQASGGTPAYKWAVTSGKLPSGLTLSSSGAISGIPTASGSSTFTASVSDSSSPIQTASASITLVVAPTSLTITASTLPSVIVGTTYSQSLKAAGGTGPYTWSITSGNLPAGLALTSSTGAISGIPTASGTSNFTATVTDSSNRAQTASATTAIVVTPTALTITGSQLPPVTVGTNYSQALKATGGTAAYKWSITSGKLPNGLTLAQSTGAISGIPTSSGVANFTATVTDSSSPVQAASAATGVVVAPTLLTITSSALPSVAVGTAYSQTLQATGGSTPYTWSITSGKLPAGLTLSASTGVLSGKPTAGGTSTFTVTVTDSSIPAQATSATTSLVVGGQGTALTIATTALPSVAVGTAYSQSLQAVGGTAPYVWSITSGQLPAGLSISATGLISGTPTTSGTSSFAVTVSDSGAPTQTMSAGMTIVTGSVPLSITSSALLSAAVGTGYSQGLAASGGTPAYTWSITSGSLPSGLTLAATTGVISGTPSTTGTSNFTAAVHDNGSPVQTQSTPTSITVAAKVSTGPGTTWYIRPDGGTRYSGNMPNGQCDGKADVAYPGSGVNQHCAFNDFRFMWDDQSYGSNAWVMAGGDTVIIRGCATAPTQQNPVGPGCRIGWDAATGTGAGYTWCYGGNGSYACSNPTIPAGTATQHTRILGGNYANCSVGNAPNPAAVTQIVGGFSVLNVLNLAGSQNVDIQCLQITSHNGQCTIHGSPSYPRHCSTSYPLDDYDSNGVVTDNTTANVLLQDVFVDGHMNSGIQGPIGGAITMNRVFVGFNAMTGWNFDNGSDTPDAPGASINANYVTMEGNGCTEEYPIVHPGYPAKACYDDLSGGFGDSWSGQDTVLASFTCNHCVQMYNTKDGFIGPHTQVTHLLIENSESVGNMGQQWKWDNTPNSTMMFINNLTFGNCQRMSQTIPGAGQNFALSTGQGGSYLSDFCRAAGDIFSFSSQGNSNVLIANNTVVGYSNTVFDLNCGPAGGFAGTCGTTPFVFQNNIFLGYTNPNSSYPQAPGLFYIEDHSIAVTSNNNIEYGIRNGDTCAGSIFCTDPLLVNEPSQTWVGETGFDNFNFYPSVTGPAVGAGVALGGITTDYYGVARRNPPSLGAIEP